MYIIANQLTKSFTNSIPYQLHSPSTTENTKQYLDTLAMLHK